MTHNTEEQENKPEDTQVEKEVEKKEIDPIDDLTNQLFEQKDKYLRLLAEYDNYRKRAAREIIDARTNTKISVLTDFLTVFDSFEMAVKHADDANVNLEIIRQGMQLIFKQYEGLLSNLGVTAYDATGKQFSPELHEAISQEPSETVPQNQVIKQWKSGYKMGDRLVRPAVVVVSSGPAKVEEVVEPTETIQEEKEEVVESTETIQDEKPEDKTTVCEE